MHERTVSRDRERQAIAQVACPSCRAAIGQPCHIRHHTGRLIICPERRQAWQAARPAAPVESADILMSDQAIGPPGQKETYLLLAPLSDRGRAALPSGLTRVEHADARATLSRLRSQGLVVMREAS